MKAALLLSGGLSERMKSLGTPKQFYEVDGKPIIMYSLMCLENCDDISFIAIASPGEWHEKITDWVRHYGISKFRIFTPPGRTRQHSVYNGLLALRNILGERDYIVIHDAARPMASVRDISDCVNTAAGGDGAMPVIEVCDTIYKSTDGIEITGLLNRNELFSGQAPECYHFGKYLAAHDKLTDDEIAKFHGSSEIAFQSGMRIRLYGGDRNNIKISTLADLKYFEYIVCNKKGALSVLKAGLTEGFQDDRLGIA
ncbi:2-C-methyl-D-erythritol 4-phosphate cytidylyltransferase [Betaproteobacteria bacterium]|nr:2-C-methyl-D-erythritol 4-phosphate cytidylyltransferase [Betaproteobacteria bacterium]